MNKTLLIVLLISGFCFGQKYELAEDFYSNGLPKAINTYKVSKNKIELIKTVEWYEDGQKEEETTYKGVDKDGDPMRDGLSTGWYENGQKKEEWTYKEGRIDGKYTGWHDNGQKSYEGAYKDGVKDGLWTYWYENGQKKSEETFKDGKRDGLNTTWYQDGRKKSEEKYVDGSTDCSFESFGGEELVVNKIITKIVKGVKNYSMEMYMVSGIQSYPNNPFETSYELPECYIETNESRKDGYWWFSNDTIHYGLKYKWIYDSDSGTITKL